MKKKSTSTTPREWVCFDKELANIMPTSEINNNHTQCKLFVLVSVSLHTALQTNWTSAIMFMIVPIYKSTWYHNPENNNLNNQRYNLRGGGEIKGIRNFNLWTNHVRNGENWFEQFLNIHTPLSPLNPISFLFASIQINSQKNYSWVEKILLLHPVYWLDFSKLAVLTRYYYVQDHMADQSEEDK